MTGTNWKIATSSGLYGTLGEKLLADCCENGVHAMELSCATHELEQLDFFKHPEKITGLAERYGVRFSSIHLPFHGKGVVIDLASPEEQIRKSSVKLQQELMKASQVTGAKIIVVHPCLEPIPDDERQLRLEQSAKSFAELVRTGEELGMQVAVENLPRSCLCRTPAEMNFLLREVPELRACFDTNHSLLQPNAEFIRALGDKIITLHISDYDFVDERHLMPGQGSVDWEQPIGELEQIGYQGYFTFELSGAKGYTMSMMKDCYRRLMDCRKK